MTDSPTTWTDLEPHVLPLGWHRLDVSADSDGARYVHTDGRVLICSVTVEGDGRPWAHLSLSRRNRLPSWEELRDVKETWLGRDRPAYQVLPRAEDYVNLHPYVLHLWTPLTGADPVPRFTRDPRRGGSL